MTDRLVIALAVVVACAAFYLVLQGYLALRRRAVLAAPASRDMAPVGETTILAFSTAECGRCHDQARALGELESRLGTSVHVRKVDALAEPALAERYGVLTVPTTVVLDAAGRPRAVNYGFAPAAKLEAQVHAAVSGEALAA